MQNLSNIVSNIAVETSFKELNIPKSINSNEQKVCYSVTERKTRSFSYDNSVTSLSMVNRRSSIRKRRYTFSTSLENITVKNGDHSEKEMQRNAKEKVKYYDKSLIIFYKILTFISSIHHQSHHAVQ